MRDNIGLIIQGNDNANRLRAHTAYNGRGSDVYNIIHAGGGDDKLLVESFRLSEYGVELYGEDGNDTLYDSEGRDTLSGGAGDDEIRRFKGADVIDGGEGIDTLYTENDLDRLSITGIERLAVLGRVDVGNFDLTSLDEVVSWSHYGSLRFSSQATLTDINFVKGKAEGFAIFGSEFDDTLDVSGNDLRFGINGNAGNDVITLGTSRGTVTGGSGDDIVTGSGETDSLDGGAGNDTIYGGDGNDLIIAEIGNDEITGGAGNDKISGETIYDYDNYPIRCSGDKVFNGGTGNDLFVNLHNLTDFNVTVTGGQGDDTLEFHGDASNMSVTGIETLVFTVKASRPNFFLTQPLMASAEFLESFKHIVSGTKDPDLEPTIQLTSADRFQWRDAETRLSGHMMGTNGDDEIDMSEARMSWTITGGNGDDVLAAGTGNDELFGGNGSDTFAFEDGSGKDFIGSFHTKGGEHDRIDLSGVKAIRDYEDLINNHVSAGGSSITFHLGAEDTVEVFGDIWSVGQLDKSLFIF
ncbi:MAG: hypothetical protein JWM58_2593 [Rhizobium sp.]|nr:hypothetical protein [Rhizobium sp.]